MRLSCGQGGQLAVTHFDRLKDGGLESEEFELGKGPGTTCAVHLAGMQGSYCPGWCC